MDQAPKFEKSVFKPLPTQKAFAQIANQIQNLIFQDVLKPGDKLPSEKELAHHFKVGRISVREALRTLEQAGFILIRQGRNGGAFVKELDIDYMADSISHVIRRANLTLDDVIDARITIESVIFEKAVQKINDNDLKRLEKNIQDYEEIVQRCTIDGVTDNDKGLIVETCMNFHVIVAKSTGNPLYELVLDSLLKATIKFLPENPLLEYQQLHLKQHIDIYHAFKNKDINKVKEIIYAHNNDLKKRVIESSNAVIYEDQIE